MISHAPSTLDLSRLHRPKSRGNKIIAQCPACAASGADKSSEHLVIYDQGAGKWGCVAFPGDKEHRRQIAAALGDSMGALPIAVDRPAPRPDRTLRLPAELRTPTVAELITLATLRNLPVFAGLEMATRAGMLRVAAMHDGSERVSAWVLLDSSNRCAQARRLDGKPWQDIGGAKAKTLSGSLAKWPIGASEIGSRPFVALTEGGPDCLAAWTLAWWHGRCAEIAPVCMTGSHPMHDDALEYFRGKGVWTFPHRDAAGEKAQATWAAQLTEAGAPWVKPFDVSPSKDLNEWLTAMAAKEDDR